MRVKSVVEMKRARQNPPETLPSEAASGDHGVFRSGPEGDQFRAAFVGVKRTAANLSCCLLLAALLFHAALDWHSFDLV
jgi:hypothetical protein